MGSYKTQRVHVVKIHRMVAEGQMLIRTQEVEEAFVTGYLVKSKFTMQI